MNYIDVDTLSQRLIENPDLVVIDVRSHEEYRMVHVPQARCIPIEEVMSDPESAIQRIHDLTRYQDTIYIICLSDRRSFMACQTLAAHNILHTCFIRGGTKAWVEAKFPVGIGD